MNESINPWKTLSATEIYENNWIKVTEFQVLNPSGNPGIYGVVHFQNYAIGVVPYEDGYIWMVGQYRYSLKKYFWEIPKGGGSMKNTPLEGAIRELKEETGLVASNYTELLQMHLSNSITDEWAIVYLATGLEQGEAEPEDTEDLQVQKMKLEDVYELVEKREITDSLTVAAIYKLMIMRLKGEI